MNVTPSASGPADRRAATLAMACLGVFVAYLPVTTVSVSLPAIQAALGASTAQLSWVQDAFVLPMAAFILTAGVFGEVHGRKKVFQAGLLSCAVGAAVALTAPSIQLLWALPGPRRTRCGRAAAHHAGPDQPRGARPPRARQVHRCLGHLAPAGTGRRSADRRSHPGARRLAVDLPPGHSRLAARDGGRRAAADRLARPARAAAGLAGPAHRRVRDHRAGVRRDRGRCRFVHRRPGPGGAVHRRGRPPSPSSWPSGAATARCWI